MFWDRTVAWNSLRRALALGLPAALFTVSLSAQTLARPGWAGSGLNGEPWWRNAVFYRIPIPTFQDSDSDGVGDLPGLTSRLDYLQTLGVDALILAPGPDSRRPAVKPTTGPSSANLPFEVLDDPGFDELISEASQRHLRVVLAQALSGDTAGFLARARLALTRGAAGIELDPGRAASSAPALTAASAGLPGGAPYILGELRSLAAGFPGERIVLSDLEGASAVVGSRAARRTGMLRLRGTEAPELETLSLQQEGPAAADPALFLRSLVASAEALPSGTAPLFRADHSLSSTVTHSTADLLAVRLLTLRGAMSLDAGQELGLPSAPSANESAAVATTPTPLMQWTPRNITPPAVKIEPNPEPSPVPTRSDVYGVYRPYVPVKPGPVASAGAPTAPPDPDTLPGFTSGSLPFSPAQAPELARRNVAVEDLDSRSLLNLYRRLIALHHGHATLRTGSTAVLETSSNAAVWIRRAPAGARTVASVIVACNLSDSTLSLSLDSELLRAHIRPGLLRPLLGAAAIFNGPQSTAHLLLAAHGVYVGEIYHH